MAFPALTMLPQDWTRARAEGVQLGLKSPGVTKGLGIQPPAQGQGCVLSNFVL